MDWISVKDKLPKTEEDILFVDDGIIRFGYLSVLHDYENDTDECYWNYGDGYRAEKVTHWMPLPPLPR